MIDDEILIFFWCNEVLDFKEMIFFNEYQKNILCLNSIFLKTLW